METLATTLKLLGCFVGICAGAGLALWGFAILCRIASKTAAKTWIEEVEKRELKEDRG